MNCVLLMYPDRSIPFVKNPSADQIKQVIENPNMFGDIGEVGGLELFWGEDVALESGNTRVVDFNNLSASSSLHFYLGVPQHALVLYSDKRLNVYQKVIGKGRHFDSEVFTADDCGGCEMEIDKAHLATTPEAMKLVREFIESEGQISPAHF